MKAGLRYEYTDTELNSSSDGLVVDRAFGALFPSAFLQHQINDNNQFNLSCSRRINRPSFSDMASFVIFLDPRTVMGGNAALQPAIADAFQVDYRYKAINFSMQYTTEDSTIVRAQNRFDGNVGIQTIIPDNLKDQQTFTASVAFPVPVTDWWKMRFFAQYTYQEATSEDKGAFYTFNQNSFEVTGSQSFELPNDFSAELSGKYGTAIINGNQRFKPVGFMNFGIQKRLKNNARLSFNIGDVFNSLEFITTTDLPQQNFFVERLFDFSQRTFNVSYSASFGNQKVKGSRKRGQVEELRQVN